MKKIIVLLCVVLTASVNIYSQKSIKNIFERYAEDDRFTYVSVGKGGMNIAKAFTDMSTMSSEEKKILSKMEGVKILTLDSNPGKLQELILADIDKIVKNGKFETVAEVRDKGERVNIYTAVDESEMLIVSKDKEELSLIWIVGSDK